MEFAAFAARAAEIEAESADLAIVERVTELLLEAGDDLPIVARFVQGRIFPAWDSTKLDVGPSACYEAIARAAGPNVTPGDVEERLAEVGDVGEVAASYDFGGQAGLGAFTGTGGTDGEPGATGAEGGRTGGEERRSVGGGSLTVREVHDALAGIARAEGTGSQDRKVDRLFGLLNRCSPTEARYLVRLVLEEMRIGVGEGTVRDAIAAAFDAPTERVERALQVSNDYGLVAEVARDEGVDGLDSIRLEVGRPVKAMLAQAGTVTDALEAWEEAAVEWKYDGARIQLHHDGEETRVFSRNMEDVTAALPEVVEFADETIDAPTILDGEVVAVDDAGEPLPFQEVLRRFRRKHDVDRAREDVEVRPVFFDCLHDDGDDLLDVPLLERHARLRTILSSEGGGRSRDAGDEDERRERTSDGRRDRASDGTERPESEIDGLSHLWVTDDPDRIEAIDADALEAGHEGIMLKEPGSTYTPGRRGKRWLKRKPDVETLDLVVTGAEWGEGRRATYLGTFLLSVRDGEEFATIGKVATGITDETLAELTELLEPHVLRQEGQTVELEPAVVFEVGYEEIQRSPTYSAGYALRFPRFVGVREDLDPADADTLERVERLRE